jgi:hypothetical protein
LKKLRKVQEWIGRAENAVGDSRTYQQRRKNKGGSMIIGLADRLGRRRGVEVDGNTKMSRGLKDREEARVVKKQTTGRAIEERPLSLRSRGPSPPKTPA